MALWRIVVKNSGNAACKDKRQRLEKGMFIRDGSLIRKQHLGLKIEEGTSES